MSEMTYAEQLLHMLEEFDTPDLHVELQGGRQDTLVWRVFLRGRNKYGDPRGYLVYRDDGGGYGFGPVRFENRLTRGLTAEQALEGLKEYLLSDDAARRLGWR